MTSSTPLGAVLRRRDKQYPPEHEVLRLRRMAELRRAGVERAAERPQNESRAR